MWPNHCPPQHHRPARHHPSLPTHLPQTQTVPTKHHMIHTSDPKKTQIKKLKKNTHTHNGSSPNWPCNRRLHSSWPSNRHLQFIVIRNPTTKLLTAEYSLRFVVKPALKPFRWRSCWSRVWNFRLELERDIFWREEKERDFLGVKERDFLCDSGRRKKLHNIVWYTVLKRRHTPFAF